VPERCVTNVDLEKFVDTSDEWIRTRTGIHQRYYVEPGTPTSALATRAAQECLERRGIAATEVDVIIVATVTPDMFFPATACIVQDKIGATRPGASTSRPPAPASCTRTRWACSSSRPARTRRS
jgi:3-oxoacyl-[acyl-carrier-protein] synthase-3